MSIRTNPMKAVPTLLKRLVSVDKQAKLKDLKSELTNIKDLFSKVKKNEQELLDKLTKVDGYLRNNNIPKLMEDEKKICQEIKESTERLLPADQIQQPEKENKETTESPGKTKLDQIEEVNASPEELKLIEKNYDSLDDHEMRFLKSLLHLPENSVMKRRNIILWWVGVGLGETKAPKENGEYVFGKFMDLNLIVPHKYDFVNKLFKANPLVYGIHELRKKVNDEEKKPFGTYSEMVTSSHHSHTPPACLALNKRKVELNDAFGSKSNDFTGIFNTGASYLIFGSQRMAKMKHLQVLQLGRWLHASPEHHIEVNSEEFLKELRDQEALRYLSLRVISRISQLPDSIFQLQSLETLDLKACHNLETLPSDIALLRNLKHLNLSQCYLLDRMPKGIDKLTKLEVLKGFVIGNSDKTPCKISDLAHLPKLKQLSMHIGSGAMIPDIGFETLEDLSVLEKLKISWGVFDIRYSNIQVNLPLKLKKLHLEGFPGQDIPEWLKPEKIISSLCELYITGGKLQSMDIQGYTHVSCSLKIIRLKNLQHLNIN
ncbi:disease resistance RPP13-like protein 4 [Vigna unguiculata]|uniref:disease resistance RPP13-like protein 4 n=1 Tax=Vigna unguiculata TaxID=3917 RepID=UPI001016D87E|nr:disease resistance RPP13-like protein 4 [Vigna unguiculata]